MKRFAKLNLVSLILLTGFVLLRGTAPQVATGTWQSGSEMSEARTGAATVTLDDGRVLVFGGTTSPDGNNAAATNAVQVFSDGSWSDLGAVMLDARSGHSATLLEDGRILLAGGENSSGPLASLEIYDPASASFSAAGTLSGARASHGAARLPGGSVLMIGGSDGTNPLASSEIYDPESGSSVPGPSLSAPRSGLSATRLLDGKVLIAGGNNGEADLASTLIYDAADGSMNAGADLSAPRSGHSAALLPNNNSVLISGGSGSASAELYIPWTGSVSPTGSMASARDGAAGSGSGWDGVALVAGGSGSQSSELYGFATVKTDDDDYNPGDIVNISGSGWQPGETVTLVLHEDADFHGDLALTAVADAFGNIANSEYAPEAHDLGVRFYLTAGGGTSNFQAQTTFTDGTPAVTNASPNPFSPNNSAGVKDTVTIEVTNQSPPTTTNNVSLVIRAGTGTAGTKVAEFSLGNFTNGQVKTQDWDGKDLLSAYVADGTYTARVRVAALAEDNNSSRKREIIVDNTNPNAPSTPDLHSSSDSGTSQIDDITSDSTPRLTGTAEVGATVEFFDGATSLGTDVASGGGNYDFTVPALSALSDGPHSITAKQTDTAGNTSGASGALSVTIDTIAPNTSIDSNPSNPSNSTSASFTFSGTDADSVLTFECKLDAAAFAACASPQDYTGLAVGSHTFQVRAIDRAGNTDASPASFTWDIVLDNIAPTTTITLAPLTPNGDNDWYTSDVHVTVAATDNAGGSGVDETRCVLDPVSVPASFDDLPASCPYLGAGADVTADGTHVVYAASIDNAGNKETPVSQSFKIDQTDPDVSCGTADTDWHATDVSIACTASDATSGLADTADASFDLMTSVPDGTEDNNASTGTHEVCDDAGNCVTAGPISGNMVDKKAPQLSGCDSPDGLWHASNVTLYCTYTDGGSGPASQQVDLSTNIDDGVEDANAAASANGAQACDAVNNCAATPLDIAGNMIDRKDPVITLTTPPDGATYLLNQAVAADYSCADGGSGVATCAGTVADGSNIDTTIGPHSFTVNATDNVGNSASVTHNYKVIYDFLGFFNPVDNNVVNVVKAGRTIPMKWQLKDANGNYIRALSTVTSITYYQIPCMSETITNPITDTADTSGSSGLRYDLTDEQFIFTWQTAKNFANLCMELRVTLDDGTTHTAKFKFTK